MAMYRQHQAIGTKARTAGCATPAPSTPSPWY